MPWATGSVKEARRTATRSSHDAKDWSCLMSLSSWRIEIREILLLHPWQRHSHSWCCASCVFCNIDLTNYAIRQPHSSLRATHCWKYRIYRTWCLNIGQNRTHLEKIGFIGFIGRLGWLHRLMSMLSIAQCSSQSLSCVDDSSSTASCSVSGVTLNWHHFDL